MIVKLVPTLKNYLWGGRKLKENWNKRADFPVAESWELSLNDGGLSVIGSGQNCGKSLSEVATQADFGSNCADFPAFPVLIKLIDAASDLSVQVHPSDEFAKRHEGAPFGKTEVWHVLDAEKGAAIYLGLQRNVDKRELQQSIADGTVLELLNKIEVEVGQTYLVPSGTLHAIGSGVTVYEIQQNSALTYRAYDYGRVGLDGKMRELHVDKVLACANLSQYRVPPQKSGNLIYKCKYFSLYRHSGAGSFLLADSFCAVTAIGGEIALNGLTLEKGETAFVSAGERFQVVGNGEYVLACVES